MPRPLSDPATQGSRLFCLVGLEVPVEEVPDPEEETFVPVLGVGFDVGVGLYLGLGIGHDLGELPHVGTQLGERLRFGLRLRPGFEGFTPTWSKIFLSSDPFRPGVRGRMTDTRQRKSATRGRPDPVHRERYRPVRLMGLLLVLQAAGLAGLVLFQLPRIEWRGIQTQVLSMRTAESLAPVLFVPTAALALLAALSFLVFSRRGWVPAAVSQGLGLGVCLWLYSGTPPLYIYPIMASCIVLVLYLNSRTVRTVFHPGRVPPERDVQP